MHVTTNDRLTALETINADRLTTVTGGEDNPSPPPGGDSKGRGKKAGKGILGLLVDPVINFVTRPVSDQFKAHMQYEMEARRSRLLSDAYGPANGSTSR